MPSLKFKIVCLLAGVGVALAIVLWLAHPQRETTLEPAVARETNSPASTPDQRATTALPAHGGNHRLQDLCAALRMQTDRALTKQELEKLRQELSKMSKRDATALVRRFLDSKEDASTRLGFKLNSSGLLDEAPTLRTWMLDELGRLDPAAAADYAKVILASMDSADEWAVALRDLALGDSSADGRALLQQKMAQMLSYAPWQQNPSAGYLEAFDVPVFLGGTGFVPALSSLITGQEDPAVTHAAFLALDRLVINNPTAVLQALENSPDSMQGRESTRADFFARADVRDPQQLQILQNYLLNPSISAAELQTFAGVFPNANYMISPNLLTQNYTPNRDTLLSIDTQSLAVAQQWLTDPHFANLTPQLQTIVQRLQGFAAQAKQGQ